MQDRNHGKGIFSKRYAKREKSYVHNNKSDVSKHLISREDSRRGQSLDWRTINRRINPTNSCTESQYGKCYTSINLA